MALYRGDTKVSGIGQSFNPENTGTEGQVLTKTCSGYAYCDVSSGGGDTYNIKYLIVGGGGMGLCQGGGGGGVIFGKKGFNCNSIDVHIGRGGGYGEGYYAANCIIAGQSSFIKNDEFIELARGGCNGGLCGCPWYYQSFSGNGFGSCDGGYSNYGGGGAGGMADNYTGGPGLCGYGGGGGQNGGCGCDGGGDSGQNATGCGGGGGYNGGAGAGGIVKICYACDGSGGITTATGGNSCYVCDGYCVHEFTSDGTFCITG